MKTHPRVEQKETPAIANEGSNPTATAANPCLRNFRYAPLLVLLVGLFALTASNPLLAQTQMGVGWDGLKGTDTWWWPNDPNAAVGPNHVVEIINGIYRIFDKQGNILQTSHIDYLFTPSGRNLQVKPKQWQGRRTKSLPPALSVGWLQSNDEEAQGCHLVNDRRNQSSSCRY